MNCGNLPDAAHSPVELAAIHDDTAESRAVATDKLGCGMHHDVGTVFKRANQVRSTEGVVDHQRNLVLVSDFGDSVDIWNVGMRVAESFNKDELRVFLDGGFDALEIVSVDEGRFDTEVTERMLQQVESTTVNRALDNHVVTTAGKSRNSVSNGSGTRGDSESGNATFEGSNTFFENTLSGVVDTAVNITTGLQGKAVCSILGVVENVRGGLVNMELKSFKMELVLCRHG